MSIKKLYKVTKITPLSNSEWQIRWGLIGFLGFFSNRKKNLARLTFHFSRHKVGFTLILGSYWLALVRYSKKFTQWTKAASVQVRSYRTNIVKKQLNLLISLN